MGKVITFETAKLASDKGFLEKTLSFYGIKDKLLYNNKIGKLSSYDCSSLNPIFFNREDIYCAPTQSQLRSWLENNGVYLYIIDDILAGKKQDYGDSYFLIKYDNQRILSDAFMTYDDAFEEGLKEGLKLL